jgi:hypothetical protein
VIGLVEEAGRGERCVAAAAEADEGAKKASVATARSDSLVATRRTPARSGLDSALVVLGLRGDLEQALQCGEIPFGMYGARGDGDVKAAGVEEQRVERFRIGLEAGR